MRRTLIGALALALVFTLHHFLLPLAWGASVELPFLAVLFGLLGGVSTLGIIGLFIGPLLVTLAFHYIRAASAVAAATPTEGAP